jgi:hypothetical protein
MSIGEGSNVGFETMRGRDYPTIRQFTVFLENRVGQLLEVVRRFEGSKVRIVALSISDAAECAFVRFLLSHPEQGREILERAGLAWSASNFPAPRNRSYKFARPYCKPRSTSFKPIR